MRMLKVETLCAAAIAICIGCFQQAHAQAVCEDIDYTLTTDPNAPSNKKFSARPNFFEWINVAEFDINSSNFPSGTIPNPFFQDYNDLVGDHVSRKDYHLADGWELILERFGYDYDSQGNKTASTQQVNHPFFILYNKYLSILRVFVAIGNVEQGYSATTLELSYYAGSAWDHISNNIHRPSMTQPIRATDILTDETEQLISVSKFTNTVGDWLWADFPIMYDPCACEHKTAYQININLIDEAIVELQYDGILIEISSQQQNVKINSGFFSLSDLLDVSSRVYRTYDDANSFANKQKAAIDSYVAAEKMSQANGEANKNSLNLLQQAIKGSGFLKSALQAIPYLGAAYTLVDYFIGSGKTSSGKTTSQSFQLKLSANGQIVRNHFFTSATISNPGGDHTPASINRTPYYDNPLGVFTVVKTPSYEWGYKLDQTLILPNSESCLWGDAHHEFYVRIPEAVKYAINPAAGFKWENPEDVEILAAIVVETKQGLNGGSEPSSAFTILETENRNRTQYVPLGCLSDMTVKFRGIRKKAYARLSCVSQNWYEANPPVPYNIIEGVYVKLLVKLKRKDGGPNVLFVGMYPASEGAEIAGSSNWTFGAEHDVPKNVTLNQEISVNTEILAWETITIEPGFQVTNGATFNAIAGQEIVVANGVEIPAESFLRIGIPVACTTSHSPISAYELTSFCASDDFGGYRPNDRTASKEAAKTGNMVDPYAQNPHVEITGIYPNPSTGNGIISLTSNGEVFVKAIVLDQVGRTVMIAYEGSLANGANNIPIDCSQVYPGQYRIAISANGYLSNIPWSIIR